MATIWKFRRGEMHTEPDSDSDAVTFTYTHEMTGKGIHRCSFCSEETASAYWRASQDISVCRHCACNVLPKLIADAVVGEQADSPRMLGDVHAHLGTVIKAYWQGVAIAVLRGVKLLSAQEKIPCE